MATKLQIYTMAHADAKWDFDCQAPGYYYKSPDFVNFKMGCNDLDIDLASQSKEWYKFYTERYADEWDRLFEESKKDNGAFYNSP
jgi:hypothetical protein